jgi:hypothetical protein
MRQERQVHIRRQAKDRHMPRSIIRRVLGWSAIVVGLLGVMLPVLPGVVFFALGALLIGPHDPTLRRIAVGIRLFLRRWSCAKQRHMRRLGRYVRSQYREQRLLLRAYLHRHEHGEESWRGHYGLLALTLFVLALTAGIGLVVWHTIL